MYSVRVARQVLKDIANLPKEYSRLVGQHIDRLSKDPRPHDAKKLKSDMGYSLRVGIYRILYDIDDQIKVITIYRVKHRREAYR